MTGKTMLSLVFTSAALLALPAHATSIAASGGDGSLGLHADTALLPTLSANVDYLRTGSARGDAKVAMVGLMLAPPAPLVHWAVGARYRYQDTRRGSGGGMELGASLFVDTPIPTLSVGGYGYYLPRKLAQGDVRQSHDYSAQLRLGLTRALYAWAGYRDMRVELAGTGKLTLYKGPAVGVSIGF